MLGGSYQSTYRGTKTSFFSLNGQPSPDPQPNTPIFESVQNRTYSNQQARMGLNLKLDYDINNRNKIYLYALYLQLEDWQHRHLLSNQLTKYGDVGNNDRSVYRLQNIKNFTLNGEHQLNDQLNVNWKYAFSQAESNTPDWTDLSVTYRTALGLDGNPVETARYVDNVSHIWTSNADKDHQGFLNFNYLINKNVDLVFGAMFRSKNRYNYYNDYSLATVLPGGNRQTFTSIENVIFSFPLPSYTYADSTNANNYSATENIQATYLQGKFTKNNLQVLGGVRLENTEQSYASKLPITAVGKNGKVSYLDILPSLHLKYELASNKNLRLSYFKGISRPGYFELIPATFPGEYFNESGNYNLKHTQSDNIDFGTKFFQALQNNF